MRKYLTESAALQLRDYSMKNFFKVLTIVLLFTACGAKEDFKPGTSDYQVREELGVTGAISLSFEQTSLSKYMSISEPQARKCAIIAEDYAQVNGVELDATSLTIEADQPSKHCARRNSFRQCETYQFVYSITCRYKNK